MSKFNGYYVHINDLFDITKEEITPDGLISVYNDILGKKSKIAIAKRIQYAFENGNGVNFWQNFFLCDERHRKNGYMIFHILTKQQLVLLQYWWKQMMDTADQTIKANLEESKGKFFGSDPDLITKTNGIISDRSFDPLYVYYVDNKFNARQLKLKRLFFDRSPAKEILTSNIGIDFFVDKISVDDVEEIAISDRNDVFREMLFSLKNDLQPKIKSKFKKEYKFTNKWLLYLGKMNYTHKWIDYCHTMKPKCPLVEAYFS